MLALRLEVGALRGAPMNSLLSHLWPRGTACEMGCTQGHLRGNLEMMSR